MEDRSLEVIHWDDPRLSVVCDAVENNEFGPELETFGQQLILTMKVKNGVGLAASQVGITKTMFVMQFPETNEEPKVIVNPIITKLSGATLFETEGCLSLPGVTEQVGRADQVTMQYKDPLGKPAELNLTGLSARIVQHEWDHTRGIMFFDRITRQMRKHVLKQWSKK